jgi:hypothetical protein
MTRVAHQHGLVFLVVALMTVSYPALLLRTQYCSRPLRPRLRADTGFSTELQEVSKLD